MNVTELIPSVTVCVCESTWFTPEPSPFTNGSAGSVTVTLLPIGKPTIEGTPFTICETGTQAPFTVPVVATADANGACVPVSQIVKGVPSIVGFPIGSKVTVTEPAEPFVNGDGSGVNQVDSQTQTVTGGINSVTFTNQAYGQFEICKNMPDSPGSVYHGLPFTFTYKGVDFPKVTGSVTVGVDACSQPQVVPVGNYAITEQLVLGFGLQSVTAASQGATNRLVSSSGNSATISVPFFSNPIPSGGDVSVLFVNAPQTAPVKVCKQLDPGSVKALGGLTFTFTLTNLNTMGTTTSKAIAPNTCFQFDNVPLVDSSGNAIPYQVAETLNNAVYVPTNIDSSGSSGITVKGTPNNNSNGKIKFTFTGAGSAVFTYTNASP